MTEFPIELPPQAEVRVATLGMSLESYLQQLFDDYVFFVEEIWHDRSLNKFAALGEPERDICRFAAGIPSLACPDEVLPNRRVILAPRGIGKTHFVTASLACWDQFRDPEQAHDLIPSKSEKEAKKTLALVRQWIEDVWFLQHLRPDAKKDHRDAATMFDVGPCTKSRNPSVAAYGIEGQIEGVRASRVIPDDVETKENTKTREAREELDKRVREFAAICSYGARDIVYVGTFHHEESLYLELGKRGYLIRTWPELFPNPDEKVINLAPMLQAKLDCGGARPGDIVFNHRRDEQYVREQQAEGRTHFAMQHMLIANLGDALRYPLQLRDLIVFPVARDRAPISIAWGTTNHRGGGTRIEDVHCFGFSQDGLYGPIMFAEPHEWHDYAGTKMWIDPAGQGADKTAYAVVSQLNGYLWTKAVKGLEGGYSPPTLNALAYAARLHNATEIFIESNFGMDMFATLFEPVLVRYYLEPGEDPAYPNGWKASITSRFSKGQKEIRIIESLEPVFNQHRVIVAPEVIANEELQKQLTRITRQRNCLKHEDELEAWSACIAEWKLSLTQDPDKAAQRVRDQWIDDAIREQQRMAGMPVREPRWFQHN